MLKKSGGRNLCLGLSIYSAWLNKEQIHMSQSTIFQEIMILVTQHCTRFILRWVTLLSSYCPFSWFPFVYLHLYQIWSRSSLYKKLLPRMSFLPPLAKNYLPCCSRIQFSGVTAPKFVTWSNWTEVLLGRAWSSKNIWMYTLFPSCIPLYCLSCIVSEWKSWQIIRSFA